MKTFTVGVIGNGFVGESQAFAFSPTCDIKIFDKKAFCKTGYSKTTMINTSAKKTADLIMKVFKLCVI